MKEPIIGQQPEDRVRVVIVQCTPLEARYVDEMRRRGGFTSDMDLVKCALGTLAHQLDLTMPAQVFAIGEAHADHVGDVRRARGGRHEPE